MVEVRYWMISNRPRRKGHHDGDRTEPPGHLPQGHIPPGHLPPGHLPPGHLPPRTYTPQDIILLIYYNPQTLKCLIWFMHHVLITYCTLKSIYFAEIAFICDVGALKLRDICEQPRGKGTPGYSDSVF